MKSIFQFLAILLFLFFQTFRTFAVNLTVEEDTIKSIPKIHKEFLISIHLVKNELGFVTFDSLNFANTLKTVNSIFGPIDATFRICDIDTVQNFQYDTLNPNFDNELLLKYNKPKRINLYLVTFFSIWLKDHYKLICGKASLGGVGESDDNTAVYLQKDCIDATTIAHELGHYFSLLHTFQGNGKELADGSNCKLAGDFICDTPADPYDDDEDVADFVDNKCQFISLTKDAKGNFYDPDVSNIMSYYTNCSCLKFSTDQYIRMSHYYLSNRGIW